MLETRTTFSRMRRRLEIRVAVLGTVILSLTAAWFALFKYLMWSSVVVHEEKASIHRQFFGDVVVRFPQETFNLVDFLTTTYLMAAGGFALTIAFWMTERLRRNVAKSPRDAHAVRRFFRIAGLGLLWLGLDEIFLIHELVSANLYVPDQWFLLAYAAVGALAALLHWRVVVTSGIAVAMIAVGVLFHGASLGMDFFQEQLGWVPEEPFEMLAAGFYATGLGCYAAKILGATPLPLPKALPLPDSAIEPLSDTSLARPILRRERVTAEVTPLPHPEGYRPDPAWTH